MKLIFDTHSHYDDERFENCRDDILDELFSSNVGAVISCAVDQFASYDANKNIAEKYKNCYFTAGVHPLNMADNGPLNRSVLVAQASHPKCVAIGEIGLDYHYLKDNRDEQISLVKEQITVANELSLPISFHDREAHEDTINILSELQPKGVVHCFSGSNEMAKEILKLGMYIGVGGVVTFNNAKKLLQVVKSVPLDRILIETDAPYLAPVPYRGMTNRSDYLIKVAEKIAEIKGIAVETVLECTYANACKLFNIK